MDLGAGLILWALLAAPDGAEVDAAVERVLAADRYQTELPLVRPPEPLPEPERQRPPRREPRRAADPPRSRDATDLRPVGSALLWIFAAAFGIAVAIWLVREFQARRRAEGVIGPPVPAEPVPAPPVPQIPDYEALALAGRHADAIHAILIAVLAAIGHVLKPAWTSREILGLVKLEDGAHRALRSLVGLVEVTRFGGAQAREAEYHEALGWLGAIGRPGAP